MDKFCLRIYFTGLSQNILTGITHVARNEKMKRIGYRIFCFFTNKYFFFFVYMNIFFKDRNINLRNYKILYISC